MIASKDTESALITQEKLDHFCMWVRDLCPESFTSIEQLWLAFVMKGYGKTWNGIDWVKEV